MKLRFLLTVVALFFLPVPTFSHEEWTNTEGKTIRATFLEIRGATVRLETDSGVHEVDLKKLSNQSQQRAKQIQYDRDFDESERQARENYGEFYDDPVVQIQMGKLDEAEFGKDSDLYYDPRKIEIYIDQVVEMFPDLAAEYRAKKMAQDRENHRIAQARWEEIKRQEEAARHARANQAQKEAMDDLQSEMQNRAIMQSFDLYLLRQSLLD